MIVGNIDESMIPSVPDRRSADPSAYHIVHEGNIGDKLELFLEGEMVFWFWVK